MNLPTLSRVSLFHCSYDTYRVGGDAAEKPAFRRYSKLNYIQEANGRVCVIRISTRASCDIRIKFTFV